MREPDPPRILAGQRAFDGHLSAQIEHPGPATKDARSPIESFALSERAGIDADGPASRDRTSGRIEIEMPEPAGIARQAELPRGRHAAFPVNVPRVEQHADGGIEGAVRFPLPMRNSAKERAERPIGLPRNV
jgi:hypothetical protein